MAGSAIARGVWLAVAAAVAFGATTPVIAWAGRGVGPLATAALLYGGAAVAALVLRAGQTSRAAPLRRADLPRVIGVAIAGGAVAPALLAWGLQRTGATVGSLLLNLEAVFTVLLARAVFGEPIGARVAAAVAAMVAGGAALGIDLALAGPGEHAAGGAWAGAGAIAVAGATLGWAIDNALTRPLAEREPLDVVAAKASLGAMLTAAAAMIAGEHLPAAAPAAVLALCGATGYGVSLRLYLLAQRAIGAARTGSVFAVAPFLGAAIAVAAGGRALTGWTIAAAGLFATGVALHLTERHGHAHVHEAEEHDHVHNHDDGHHDPAHGHVHDPPVAGAHAHRHRHDRLEHSHDHAPDLHHAHDH